MYCIKSHILIWNTEITNEKVLNDSVKLKMVLGRFGRKMKILHILHKSHILFWNTEITYEKVLNDSVKLKTVLGRFWQKIKIVHNVLHKIAHFDLEHRNNQ